MKYTKLVIGLSLALAGGIAAADEAQPTEGQTTETQGTQTTETNQSNISGQKTGAATAQDSSNVQDVDLLFQTSSAQIASGADQRLEELVHWAACNPKGALILEGHADPRGTQDYNLKLSGRRAATVREKLISMGVPSDRIVVSVFGENGPRRGSFAQDRRVTIRAANAPVQPRELTATR